MLHAAWDLEERPTARLPRAKIAYDPQNALACRVLIHCAAAGRSLTRNLSESCECWDYRGCYGATGVMFKITVSGFHYTFMGKGVQKVHRGLLEREAALYERVAPLQGRVVPVCLGLVHLVRPCPLTSLAVVSDMLLLAWAGPSLYTLANEPRLEAEVDRTETELERAGVLDGDSRSSNLTWSEELRRVMRIDLGDAELGAWADKVLGDMAAKLSEGESADVSDDAVTKRLRDDAVEDVHWAPKKRPRLVR